jgi:uncharacterized membrane protein HdeD (DUF308 family)
MDRRFETGRDDRMTTALVRRWWALALRGLAAITFGILTFLAPGASLYALVILFGVFSLVDGALNLITAVRDARGGRRWGAFLLAGIAGIGAGVVTLLWPAIGALALLMLIAAWAVVTGVAEIAAAIRLRKVIKGEWLLGLSGVLSIAFGVLMFLFPSAGALAVVLWIGAYALVLGVLNVALAVRLRSWGRPSGRRVPTGGVPAPA